MQWEIIEHHPNNRLAIRDNLEDAIKFVRRLDRRRKIVVHLSGLPDKMLTMNLPGRVLFLLPLTKSRKQSKKVQRL